MHARTPATAALIALATLCGPSVAHGISVDGVRDPEYGPPLAIQSTQTGAGNNTQGQVDYSLGSELDEVYGVIADGTLYLFFSGNLTFYWSLEGQTVWLPLDVYVDSKPGGQNVLLANNPAPDPAYDVSRAAGMTFDTGVSPDYWLSVGGNAYTWPNLRAYEADLSTGGGGSGAYLGTTPAGGTGALSGGSNPFGIQVAMDERNVAGVTYGCGPESGTGATRGIEWAIPLAAIGNPTGCVNVCALVPCADHSCISNQVLGPIPPGTCGFSAASAVNFAAIPGAQYVTVCGLSVPTLRTSWGVLKQLYR